MKKVHTTLDLPLLSAYDGVWDAFLAERNRLVSKKVSLPPLGSDVLPQIAPQYHEYAWEFALSKDDYENKTQLA